MNFTDFDMAMTIVHIAIQLKLNPADYSSPSEIFQKVKKDYPKVAEILEQVVAEKDSEKEFLLKNPRPLLNGNIVVEGDPVLEKHWQNLVDLNSKLNDVISNYN